MIVYFCCAGGPTSMFFANCARRIFKNEDKIYVDNIRKAVRKYLNGELDNYDLIFAQGTGFSATHEFFSENHFSELVAGLQISGKSEIIEINCSEYYDIMKMKNLFKESLIKFQLNLNIVKICPVKFEFINLYFGKDGYYIKKF